jgi:hypothetical protein
LHNNHDDGALQRIADMRNTPAVEKVLQGMVMDLLRVLSAPDLEVRKRTLEIVMRYAALPLAIPARGPLLMEPGNTTLSSIREKPSFTSKVFGWVVTNQGQVKQDPRNVGGHQPGFSIG